jgi:putative colanic acid biosynthesis UDP-glucose lipid carrier transferase
MFGVLRFMRAKGWNERRVIILGSGELGMRFAATVQQAMWTGYRILALFDDDAAAGTTKIKDIPVLVTPAKLDEYISQQTIDEVWLAFPFSAEEKVKHVLHELRHQTITTRLLLDVFGLDLLNCSINKLAGFPVLNVRSTPMVGGNRLIKAFEDRFLAALILLLTIPLFIVVPLAIKLTSKGPVFYRQKRISWNGKEFDMLKFRTMPVDAEAATGPVWAKAGEKRATGVGAFLRKTSIDEFPQFINVLRGEMSIVGPRPERLIFVEEFKDKIPGYMQKHLMKAGITGWAQINGWRGNTSLEKRIEYDLFYIENWSFFFDMKIIFLTVFRGLINKNAY